MNPGEVPRIRRQNDRTNPVQGRVVWSPVKSLWFTAHTLIGLIGFVFFWRLDFIAICFLFTVTTLCLGHTIGLHRLLVHRSFECPQWLENILVHLGVLVGMGGPFAILHLHDLRDWAQRHEKCHPFFIAQNTIGRDFVWQMHCAIKLDHAPALVIEPRVASNRFFRFMDRAWMLQQLPWALGFYTIGGPGLVIWCISTRISVSLLGHWLVGYLAHNSGDRDWHLQGHAVQGYNVPHLGLLTMGESWHNNHHAFPGSAKLGLFSGQTDPGWWTLCVLRRLGLVWNIKLPSDLPVRQELSRLHPSLPIVGRRAAYDGGSA